MTTLTPLQDLLQLINSNIYSSTNGKLDPDKDPMISAMSYSLANLFQGLQSDLYDSTNQMFARTATEESFISAGAFDKTNNRVIRKPADFATGDILVVSDSAEDISVGSEFITQDGNVYESTVFRSTFSQTINVTSIVRSSNVATVIIPDHNLGNLMDLTIAGANESGFNGDQQITIVDKDTLTYSSTGSDETATGTITATFFGVRVPVKSVLATVETNKTFNNSVDFAFTTDATNAYITFNGITGGQNIEDLISFKNRVVDYLQFPQNPGNVYQHITWIKQNTDANYCYFYNNTDDEYLYLTSVVSKLSEDYYFTNFTTLELSNMKAKFIDNNQFTLSGVDSLQLSFVNPTFVDIDITINDLTPLSNSMKTSINNRLRAYIALLPINFYLQDGQLSANKISSVVSGARDEAGNVPSFTSISVTGASFSSNSEKPRLGVVSYA